MKNEPNCTYYELLYLNQMIQTHAYFKGNYCFLVKPTEIRLQINSAAALKTDLPFLEGNFFFVHVIKQL